jgi:MFS family permease
MESRTSSEDFEAVATVKVYIRETLSPNNIWLGRSVAFWTLAAILAALLAAASAPSPLYVVYQARWGFSALTLTLVFAVYVLALLSALLCAGAVSDRIGRRPAILVALALQMVAMVAFILADSVGWLFAARVVQGVATGVATSALGGAIVDFQPEDRRVAPLVNSVAPMIGLGAGALLAGLLVQLAPSPMRLVYWVLLGVYVVATLAVLAMPETVSRQPGWWRTLVPKVAVPAGMGPTFAAVAPGLIAVWALGGLYLSLGPSLTVSLLHSDSHLVGGLVIVALAGAGAIATVALRTLAPRSATVGGSLVLLAGVGLTLIAIRAHSTVAFFAGSVIAGAGFGPAFAGAFRTLTAGAPPGERAALIAAIYVVSYLAFSLPAIAAGVEVTHSGLRDTATGYAAAIMALAALATLGSLRQVRAPVQ